MLCVCASDTKIVIQGFLLDILNDIDMTYNEKLDMWCVFWFVCRILRKFSCSIRMPMFSNFKFSINYEML